jgi:hypothetical protein
MLAGGDHAAGIFLANLVTYTPKNGWCLIEPAVWMQACCLTFNQLEDVMTKLDATGLIERWRWSSGGKEGLLLAPSQKTISYLRSATTWEKAKRCVPEPGVTQKKTPLAALKARN